MVESTKVPQLKTILAGLLEKKGAVSKDEEIIVKSKENLDTSKSPFSIPLQKKVSISSNGNAIPPRKQQSRSSKTRLTPLTKKQMQIHNNLNTGSVAIQVKQLLSKYCISQKLFGKSILGVSQGSVSDLLCRPKKWNFLKQNNKESYIRMQMFLKDKEAIRKLFIDQYKSTSINYSKLPECLASLENTLKDTPTIASDLTHTPVLKHHKLEIPLLSQESKLVEQIEMRPDNLNIHLTDDQNKPSNIILGVLYQYIPSTLYEMTALREDLKTETITTKVKEILYSNNIGQRIFGEAVLGLSQSTVSELLTKPKPWHTLSIKGREPFIRMHLWLSDSRNVTELQALKSKFRKINKRCISEDRSIDNFSNVTVQITDSNSPKPSSEKKKRMLFTEEQLKAMHLAFALDPYANNITTDFLKKEYNITTAEIKNWFYNQRMRLKQQAYQNLSKEDEHNADPIISSTAKLRLLLKKRYLELQNEQMSLDSSSLPNFSMNTSQTASIDRDLDMNLLPNFSASTSDTAVTSKDLGIIPLANFSMKSNNFLTTFSASTSQEVFNAQDLDINLLPDFSASTGQTDFIGQDFDINLLTNFSASNSQPTASVSQDLNIPLPNFLTSTSHIVSDGQDLDIDLLTNSSVSAIPAAFTDQDLDVNLLLNFSEGTSQTDSIGQDLNTNSLPKFSASTNQATSSIGQDLNISLPNFSTNTSQTVSTCQDLNIPLPNFSASTNQAAFIGQDLDMNLLTYFSTTTSQASSVGQGLDLPLYNFSASKNQAISSNQNLNLTLPHFSASTNRAAFNRQDLNLPLPNFSTITSRAASDIQDLNTPLPNYSMSTNQVASSCQDLNLPLPNISAISSHSASGGQDLNLPLSNFSASKSQAISSNQNLNLTLPHFSANKNRAAFVRQDLNLPLPNFSTITSRAASDIQDLNTPLPNYSMSTNQAASSCEDLNLPLPNFSAISSQAASGGQDLNLPLSHFSMSTSKSVSSGQDLNLSLPNFSVCTTHTVSAGQDFNFHLPNFSASTSQSSSNRQGLYTPLPNFSESTCHTVSTGQHFPLANFSASTSQAASNNQRLITSEDKYLGLNNNVQRDPNLFDEKVTSLKINPFDDDALHNLILGPSMVDLYVYEFMTKRKIQPKKLSGSAKRKSSNPQKFIKDWPIVIENLSLEPLTSISHCYGMQTDDNNINKKETINKECMDANV